MIGESKKLTVQQSLSDSKPNMGGWVAIHQQSSVECDTVIETESNHSFDCVGDA
jgi:hypothetical protein